VGGYAFVYAKGFSYLLTDPTTCANCHVMRTEYDAWIKSSHHPAATCNDCHTSHNLAGKHRRLLSLHVMARKVIEPDDGYSYRRDGARRISETQGAMGASGIPDFRDNRRGHDSASDFRSRALKLSLSLNWLPSTNTSTG
jgi:hypothetical protein